MDSRGKYISFGLKKFYKEEKVVIEFTLAYTPKQNFITKWAWHILNTIKDIILVDSKFLKKFWAEAMGIATYLKNFLSTSSKEKITKKLWNSKRQDISHLIIFECLAYVKIPKKREKSLNKRSRKVL